VREREKRRERERERKSLRRIDKEQITEKEM